MKFIKKSSLIVIYPNSRFLHALFIFAYKKIKLKTHKNMPPLNFGKNEDLRDQLNTDCYFTAEDFINLHEKIVSLIKKHYDDLKKEYKKDNIDVQGFPKFTKREVRISDSKTLYFTTMPIWLYNRKKSKKNEDNEPRDEKFITINDLIKKDERIIEFFAFCNENKILSKKVNIKKFGFGNRLYQYKNDFGLLKKTTQLKEEKILLKAHHICLFSLYLITDNRASNASKIFKKYFEPINSNINRILESEKDNYTGEYNHYVGFYYSHYTELKIKNFLLEFSKDQTSNGRYSARQIGIFNNDDFKDNELLQGEAELKQNYMFCTINGKDHKRLNITLALNGSVTSETENKYITGGVQGVSSYGHIFQLGVLLIKVSKEQRNLYIEKWKNPNIKSIINNENLWILDLFLATRRDTNYISLYKGKSLIDLPIGTNQITSLKNIAGTYKLWNFGENIPDRVIQSKLIIRKDGTAILNPYINSNDSKNQLDYSSQEMSLEISEVKGGKLNLIGTSYHSRKIMNVAIFDFSPSSKDGIIEGVFLSTGYGDTGFIGGYTVMKKMKEEDTDFDVRSYSREEMEKFIINNKAYRVKIAKLYSIWKKKTWKNIPLLKDRISYLRKIQS